MKKQRKEQIKKGGEMARALYQAFIAQPQWTTHISKDELIQGLRAYIEYEDAMYNEIIASMAKLAKYKPLDLHADIKNLKAISSLAGDGLQRSSSVHAARKLLRLFENGDWRLQAPNIVHLDFSMYCRDN